MAGALSGFVHDLLGADNPSTDPTGASADEARDERRRLGRRESGNYAQEQDLAGVLRGTIAGTNGPSVAQTQLRQGLDQSNADALAAGAGATGVNSVLARYQARQAQGEQGARIQQAAAILRAQEVADATRNLAALRNAMGNQTAGLYGANLSQAFNYDALKAQLDQQNAQRDTVLGAAGLSGAAQGIGSISSYFGNKSDSSGK